MTVPPLSLTFLSLPLKSCFSVCGESRRRKMKKRDTHFANKDALCTWLSVFTVHHVWMHTRLFICELLCQQWSTEEMMHQVWRRDKAEGKNWEWMIVGVKPGTNDFWTEHVSKRIGEGSKVKKNKQTNFKSLFLTCFVLDICNCNILFFSYNLHLFYKGKLFPSNAQCPQSRSFPCTGTLFASVTFCLTVGSTFSAVCLQVHVRLWKWHNHG